MRNLFRDLSHALRSCRGTPGFTLTAVTILAVGVAAVTLQASIVLGVLLRPLPVPGGEAILALHWHDPERQPAGPFFGLPHNDVPVWQAQQRTFASTTAYGANWAAIVQDGPQALRFAGCYVQANFFDFLGVKPRLGRGFDPEADVPGATPSVVLSHRFWQEEFAGRSDIIGRSFSLNGKVATVVGVMGPEFTFPQGEDLWIPLNSQYAPREQGNAYSPFVNVIGRLAPGVPRAAARAELEAQAQTTARQFPATNERFTGAVIEPLTDAFVAPQLGRLLWLMLGAVVTVLFLACGNVMNLLLARGASRSHDLAVRAALGASPGALLRQALAEAGALALGAIALGNVVAWWVAPRFWTWTQTMAFRLPPWMEFAPDGRVMLATSAFSLAAVLAAAVAPGLVLARLPIGSALREGGRGGSSRLAGRVTSGFVVVQVGLTVVLLAWTGLVVRSVRDQLAVDWGYNLDGVLTARVGLFPSGYPSAGARREVTEKILRELRGSPGVSEAAVTDRFRMMLENSGPVRPAGRDTGPSWPQAWIEGISDGYCATLRLPVAQGREFSADEQRNNRPVALVNGSFARRFFPRENPIGQVIELQGSEPGQRTIIGLVPDTLMEGPGQQAADGAGIFIPWSATVTTAGTLFPTFVVRGVGRPEILERTLREAIARVDPGLAPYFVGTPRSLVREFFAASRMMTWLLTAFTGIALFLAATGIFGLMSASVAQRLREFAIRLALGAGAGAIVREVLRQCSRELAAGLALGLAASVGSVALLSGSLSGLLHKVSVYDPFHYALVAAVIAAAALAACAAPAWKALRANPIEALR